MELVIKAIEAVAGKFLGHKDSSVVFQGVAIELVKHLLNKYEDELKKEDIFKIIEVLVNKDKIDFNELLHALK